MAAIDSASTVSAADKRRRRRKKGQVGHDKSRNSLEDQCREQTTDSVLSEVHPCGTSLGTRPSVPQAQKKVDKGLAKPPEKGKVSPESSRNALDVTDGQSSFSDELEWCIAQLEAGLFRKDASSAQKKENERNIKTLRSSKAPMPRKRQLMRSLFGDYRGKMRVQPLSTKASAPVIVSVERQAGDASGRFYKHAAANSQGVNSDLHQDTCVDHMESRVNNFQFNFDIT